MLLEPVLSVANMAFYREVPRRSTLRACGYVLYLGLLFSLAATLAVHLRLRPIINESVDWAASSLPVLTVSGGKVSSSLSAPLRLQHPRVPRLAFMIDTARVSPVTPQEMEEARVSGYLTQSALYVVTGPNKLEQHDLSKASPAAKPLVLDAQLWRSLGGMLIAALYPASLGITWLFFVPWKLLAALFYSLIGLLLNALLATELKYADLFKIAVYAQTPVVLLETARLFMPSPIPGLFFIAAALLIVSAYTWAAVRQNRPESAA